MLTLLLLCTNLAVGKDEFLVIYYLTDKKITVMSRRFYEAVYEKTRQ